MSARGRTAYIVLSIVAWVGVACGVFVTFSGLYPTGPVGPTQFTNMDSGFVSGFVDYWSYFTHVSNVLVAVVATMLARNPGRRGRIFDVLVLDALVMIVVTALIYNLVLAPGLPPLTGMEEASNLTQHVVTPIAMVVVFLIFGPRPAWSWRSPLEALVIPLIYAAWTLLHGAVVGAYPYGILDVITNGYASVLSTIFGLCLVGLLLGYVFVGVSRVIGRSRTGAMAA